MQHIVNLAKVTLADHAIVGGKNASTGEMIHALHALGIKVPGGFATTTDAYRAFITQQQLTQPIKQLLQTIRFKQIHTLNQASLAIRKLILNTPFLPAFEREVTSAYIALKKPVVAVRSSATAEDLIHASFAGQQETFLNIQGIHAVLKAMKLVFASLFTSRAISYRKQHRVALEETAISVGIQPMIRSDKGASGVIFTLDTESGFKNVILITATYGLGESIAQGKVNPDEFYVFKPALAMNRFAILSRKLGNKALKMVYADHRHPLRSVRTVAVAAKQRSQYAITDQEIQHLARQALRIEQHYQKPMDIEWAKDGLTGEIFILQARPETTHPQHNPTLTHYTLSKKGKIIVTGQSVGQHIGQGYAKVIKHPKHIALFKSGDVLVTDMTDPNWEPIMKRASAIVTNRGGRTCHAAIIARELGIPAIVGCDDATKKIKNNMLVTVSCMEGQIGYVYKGRIPYTTQTIDIGTLPSLPVKLYLNVGNPEKAFTLQALPNHGVGLARLEFIINTMIGIHPNAILSFTHLPKKLKMHIQRKIAAYANPVEFYIEKLREGIATIAAAFSPKEVIFRFSDFKSNEYRHLIGGELFEPQEENPMLGFRGAARYIHPSFKACFELECISIKRVREDMQLTNAHIMIPFVRTPTELQATLQQLQRFGLKRGAQGLRIYMMCELPSNVLLANAFLKQIDGFSIGSNDLTQLTLGLDRDSHQVADRFDERDAAVKQLMQQAIMACKKQNKYIGICGQGPSDHPDLGQWLLSQQIDSLSLNADSIIQTWLMLAKYAHVSSVHTSYT